MLIHVILQLNLTQVIEEEMVQKLVFTYAPNFLRYAKGKTEILTRLTGLLSNDVE